MTHPLLARVAALALAAAVALAGLAPAPAAAGHRNDDLLHFFAGAATAIIVLRALDAPRSDWQPAPRYHVPFPSPGRPAHLYLPPACAHAYAPESGRDVIFLASCLRNAGYHWGLPDRCAVPVVTNRGTRRGYSGNCLYRAGYFVGGGTGW
ncbi:MAG: hypothetical protein IT545_02600 [Rhodobacteraceae bacterium]|nr:hypothetical protein [Paracoccaceae bacterium]